MLSQQAVRELLANPISLGPPLHAFHDAALAAKCCGTWDPDTATQEGVLEDWFRLLDAHDGEPRVAAALCATLYECCCREEGERPWLLARRLKPAAVRRVLRMHGAASVETSVHALHVLAFAARHHADNAAMVGAEVDILECRGAHEHDKRVARAAAAALTSLATNAFHSGRVRAHPKCAPLLAWAPRPAANSL